MKTIEERAKRYVRKIWAGGVRDWGTNKQWTAQDFIAGAKSEHEELTRWHDPKDKLPDGDQEVLCVIHKKYNTYAVLKYYQGEWWQQVYVPAGGWCGYDGEIIAWREIHE